MPEKSLVTILALVCALTLAATPVLAAPGAPSDATPALTTEGTEATVTVTVDPFPTLETWLAPSREGLGYCYHDCSPCMDWRQCGGFPCTSVPAC